MRWVHAVQLSPNFRRGNKDGSLKGKKEGTGKIERLSISTAEVKIPHPGHFTPKREGCAESGDITKKREIINANYPPKAVSKEKLERIWAKPSQVRRQQPTYVPKLRPWKNLNCSYLITHLGELRRLAENRLIYQYCSHRSSAESFRSI